jgi:hypothetical protein
MTQSQMSDSFQSITVTLRAGEKTPTAHRTTNIPKSAMTNPIQVAGDVLGLVAVEEFILWDKTRRLLFGARLFGFES